MLVNGQVWMEAVPADSIFHARFHIKGDMKNGPYDYFYDGTNSYEANHQSKEIRLTNPHLFANDEHNPSKTRVAMLLFNNILTDGAFKSKLLKEEPAMSLQEQPAQYIITLDYPVDKMGSKGVKTLYIDRASFAIKHISTNIKWRGARYQIDMVYDNIVVNNKDILAQIPVTQSYSGYVVNEKKPEKNEAPYVSPLIGTNASLFSYKTFDNKQIKLADLKGKYVVLDFWETWCGACIMAMPEMQQLHDKYKTRGVTFLSVTTESPAKVDELRKINKLTYPGLIADKNILRDYQIDGRPTYVVIDPAGKIIEYKSGDLPAISKKIAEVLD